MLFTPQALVSLHDYLQARVIKSEKDPIFVSLSDRNYGKKLTIFSLSRIIKRRLRAAGFDSKRITAHSLRHTFASNLLEEGAEVISIRELLGHASVASSERYARLSNRRVKQEYLLTMRKVISKTRV